MAKTFRERAEELVAHMTLEGCVALVLILAHLLDHKEHDGAT